MLICYFGYVYIAVSGVVASLISFSPVWYLPVPGANAIPAAPPRVQLLMPLVLEPETTELKRPFWAAAHVAIFSGRQNPSMVKDSLENYVALLLNIKVGRFLELILPRVTGVFFCRGYWEQIEKYP